MRYKYDSIKLKVETQEFNKNSGKEVLQYAVGALLYMPASNDKIAKKIINKEISNLTSLVLDLEDSLGDELVKFGQASIVKTMSLIDEAVENGKIASEDVPLIFVRVRSYGQMKETLVKLKENIKYITGFNIPKFDKDSCDKYIVEFKEVQDKASNDYNTELYMMPIIENKKAMYKQLRIENLLYVHERLKAVQDNVLNIRVGGADFCSLYGIRRGKKESIYDIGVVRSVLCDIINVFGKSYVVSGPVWEYFENKEDTDKKQWVSGLKNELRQDKLNGFIGKTAIHPSQLSVIQESLIVDEYDYLDAISIMGMNSNTVGVVRGQSGDRMNEVKTHFNWAKKIISLANIYGVK
jgi:citrate lyase beta subunit